jgi:murein DD-endopeptidase MepM/ murein hydrolase activator NlpD
VPKNGEPGSFRINDYYMKLKKWHTGIDLAAPPGSPVLAIEDCRVVKIGQFTGAPDVPWYRKTWFVQVENASGNVAVYGEVRKPRFAPGRAFRAGERLGSIAIVEWARNARPRGRSMLHFELYKPGTKNFVDWWHKGKPWPKNLLDPTRYLESCLSKK